MMQRSFDLPFGYQATFQWKPESGFKVRWEPDRPLIRQTRAQRKFFEAYQAARRSFLEDIAAIVGGKVLIVDAPGFQDFEPTEIITPPTRH
jgi:hypothetical protein